MLRPVAARLAIGDSVTPEQKATALRTALVALKEAVDDMAYYRREGTPEQLQGRMNVAECRADDAQTILEEIEQ